jgi:hypothetical protein
MNGRGPRHTWRLVLRRCLAIGGPAALLAIAAAWFAVASQPDDGSDPTATAGTQAPWLLLALLVTMAAVAFAAVRFWPTFARGQTGLDWLRQRQRGPLAGCGAAIFGALVTQALLTAPLAIVLLPRLGAPPTAREQRVLPAAATLFVAGAAPLRIALLPGSWSELRLRPLAGPPSGPLQPTVVRVRRDGEEVGRPAFASSQQAAHIALPPARSNGGATIELEHAGGNVPLFFADDGLEVIAAASRPTIANALLLAALALLPTFAALALCCFAGASAALPTVLLLLGCCLFLSTVGEIGPLAPAARAALRGQWLGTFFPACWPTVVVGSAAMIAARLVRAWRAE